jgi:phage terminase large subunit-like protein
VKLKLGLAKGKAIPVLQQRGNANAAIVNKRAVAAAQIDEIDAVVIQVLQQGVLAGDTGIVEDNGVALIAAQRPSCGSSKNVLPLAAVRLSKNQVGSSGRFAWDAHGRRGDKATPL